MKKEEKKNKDKIIIGIILILLIGVITIVTIVVLNKDTRKSIDLDYVFELKERNNSGKTIKTKEFEGLEPISTQNESIYEINTYKVNDGFNIVVFSYGENIIQILLVNRASGESCDIFKDDVEYFLKYI